MSTHKDPRIGDELLGYRIEAFVGRGGMGVVYRAHDPRLKRSIALKLIAPELSGDARFCERFLAETELAASLEHPNVVPIHEAGDVEGQLYIAMRYVEGVELKTLLQQQERLEPGRALAICGQVAAALDAAHQRGLVHRDVKPSNVLLDENEHAYLADFGLSRRLADRGEPGAERLSVGTPAYASPEQIEGGDADGRADVYSLGCLLYECLTGHVPFARASELATLWAHVQERPPRASEQNADLSIELDAVFDTALAKDPEQRYATCGELIDAAQDALGVAPTGLRRSRRRTMAFAAAAVLSALAVVAAGLVLAFGGGSSQAKPSLVVRDNTLVRVDPKTNRIAAVIPVGRGAGSVAYGGNTVWVYNEADRTVEGIDTGTNRVVAPPTAISGSAPIPVFRHPIAADREGAWVLSVEPSGQGLLTRVQRNFPSTRQLRLADSPVSVALGDGSIWVTTSDVRGAALLRIDPRTETVTGKLDIADLDAMPNWIAVGEGAVWLTSTGPTGSRLLRVDPETMRLTGARPFDCSPGSCSTAAGSGSVWIATEPTVGRARLLRIDSRTLRVTGVILARPAQADVGPGGDFAIDGTTIWWGGDPVVRVDTGTSRIVGSVRLTGHSSLFHGPGGIVTGGGSVWTTYFAVR